MKQTSKSSSASNTSVRKIRKKDTFNVTKRTVTDFQVKDGRVLYGWYLSIDNIESILIRHLPDYDRNTPEFKEDVHNLYVYLNIWCDIYHDVTNKPSGLLAQRIVRSGLSIIEEASDYKLYITSGNVYGSDSTFWAYSLEGLPFDKRCNTLLSFPKRINIIGTDVGPLWSKFVSMDTELRAWPFYPDKDRSGTVVSEYIVRQVREELNILFSNYRRHDELFVLPQGETAEGAHTYYEKWDILRHQSKWLYDHGIRPLYFQPIKDEEPLDYNIFHGVPKNWKTPRGIAPEPTVKQVFAYQVSAGMRECLLRDGTDLNNQEINAQATFDFSLATGDLSSASDSIGCNAVAATFPTNLYNDLYECRSRRTKKPDGVPGRTFIINNKWSTMGNATTFDIETSLIKSICKVGCRYQMLFTQGSDDIDQCTINVYGDDFEVPVDCFAICCELLECFGFSVNREKSFDNDLFRESCGREVYRGVDVTPSYCPRGTGKSYVNEWIALQHELVSYTTANWNICRVISDVLPDITSSNKGSTHTDLWDPFYQPNFTLFTDYAKFVFVISGRCHWYVSDSSLSLKGKKSCGWHDTWFAIELDCELESKPSTREVILSLVEKGIIPPSAEHTFITPIIIDRKLRHSLNESIERDQSMHTTFTSVVGIRNIPDDILQQVELLGLNLYLGRGMEHINSSVWTAPENMIVDRRDLIAKRLPKIIQKKSND